MSYLLPAALALLAAWPAYALLLRYSDRYGLNRLLLVAGMLTICLFPFVELPTPVPAATEIVHESVVYLEDVMPTDIAPATADGAPVSAPEITATDSTPPRSWTWWQVYLGGLALCLVLLGVRMLALLTSHLRSRPNGDGSYRLLHPAAKAGQAYTFGRALYFSVDVPDGPDFDQVLAHERVHARQLHTFDVLLSEIFVCLLWFHPAAWWLRTKVRANLEYLVDKTVVRGGVNRRTYQLALVRQSQGAQALALALPFSEPSLKSRISRMTGLPHHWAVAAVATVAMVFWLGVSALVMLGSNQPKEDFIYSEPYVNYFADKIPETIVSFDVYGRRAPTVDEYYQLRAILQRIPGAKFYVYNTKDNPDNFKLRIAINENHAELPFAISEEISADIEYRLGLMNLFVPEDLFADIVGSQWVAPVAELRFTATEGTLQALNVGTIVDSDLINREDPGYGRWASSSWMSSRMNLKRHPLDNDEGFVVKINGEKIDLLPSEIVDGVGHDGRYYLLDNGNIAPVEWTGTTQTSPIVFQSLSRRMTELVGCADESTCKIGYISIPYKRQKSYRSQFFQSDFPRGRSVLSYQNSEPDDLDKLLDTDFGPDSHLHIGWSNEDQDGPVIVQVVNDALTQKMREIRETMAPHLDWDEQDTEAEAVRALNLATKYY